MMVQMKEIRQLYVVPCTYGDVMYCVDIDQNTVSNLQWHNHVCINHRSFFFFFFAIVYITTTSPKCHDMGKCLGNNAKRRKAG